MIKRLFAALLTSLLLFQTALAQAVINPNPAVPAPQAYVSGMWYLPFYFGTTGSNLTLSANTMVFSPFVVFSPITIKALAVRISTADSGGNLQIAVYAQSTTTGRPTGAPLGYTGSISTTSTGPASGSASSNFTLMPGIYYAAFNADNSTVTIGAMNSNTGQGLSNSSTLSNLISGSNQTNVSLSVSQTFGTWPNVTGDTFTEGNSVLPYIAMEEN